MTDAPPTDESSFQPWEPGNLFSVQTFGAGALSRRASDGAVRILARDIHTNRSGVVHGGLLSSLVDITMAFAVARRFDARVFTVSLNLNFLGSARPGDEVVATPTLDRVGRSVAFCGCTVRSGDRTLVTAQATFMPARGPAAPGTADS